MSPADASIASSRGDHCPDLAALVRFAADDPSDAAEHATIAGHLEVCESCRGRLAEIREFEDFLARLRPRETAPPRLTPTDAREAGGGPGPALAPEIAERPGSIVGRYTLLEQIGEGGFGVVFSAEQREPVARRVALKILKPGMDSRQVLARFEAERHTLAKMDHPNIARVLDAGATEAGRPYFVMELVEGEPITRFCDGQRLTLRERLDLFRTVCAAVQHAHQKGVIHRDLKPSNVLVALKDGAAVPKVIDFGIAKATDQHLTEQTVFTRLGQFIGTPEYMSPEQASGPGVDIDTRSDVYSLGVLLYELLTGATPHDPESLRRAGLAEIQRIIREGETPKPSTRISTVGGLDEIAASRRIEPRRLATQLRGDLDWILLKALEKDRARRYDTVAAMSEDLRRYLESEPVAAGPPSAIYRVRKFARRNRGTVIAGSAVALAVLAGLAAATVGLVQARTAEKQRAAEASWANQVASVQTTPFLSDELRESHRAEWEKRLETMRKVSDPDDPDLIRQEGLYAVWGWASYVGEGEVTTLANVPPPRYGVLERVHEARVRRAEAAEQWGARVGAACERARGILAISDPLWVALLNDVIRWERARGASAPELAAWYDTMAQASDAAYGEISDFSLAMLCERAAALGETGDFEEGMRTIEEYVERRQTAVVTLSDEQYMRHERIVGIYDGHNKTDTYWRFMRIFHKDAKDLTEQGTTNYSMYSGQLYGLWLWENAHYEEADQVFSELLLVMRGPGANLLTRVRLQYRIGVCRMMMGKPAEALDLLREAEVALTQESISGYQALYRARARDWLGQCLSDLGRYDEAEPVLLAAHQWHAQNTVLTEHLLDATRRLAELYERWGRREDAELWRAKLAEGVNPVRDIPDNLDFERGAEGEFPPGWIAPSRVVSAGAGARLTLHEPAEGAMCAQIPSPPPGQTINDLLQSFSAVPYRDARVRISASVRVDSASETDRAEFWIHIQPDEFDGFLDFERFSDLPIRWPQWDRFEFERDIPGDAARLLFGVSVFGNATAWLDDVRIEVIEPEAADD